jgi:acetoacetyl-CoA synthetase
MTKLRKTPLWRPENTEETNIRKFMQHVNKKHDLHLETYDDLWGWSVSTATVRDFWKDAYIFLGISPKSGASDVGVSFGGTVSQLYQMNRLSLVTTEPR